MSNKVNIQAVGVRLESLTKVFLAQSNKVKDFMAVSNVSLEVLPGEMVTLLGPSGCGKTTILRMLSGFTVPTEGKIYFGDEEVSNVPSNKRNVGMMFQSYALFPHLSVYDNVAYGLRVQKIPQPELKKRMDSVLSLMQIEAFADRIPEQLSGGQQQRVALARAIVTEPRIMLYDEPLSNLDAKMREYMREELRKIQKSLGITSIYVTHDQSEAMAISDKVVIMNAGQIEQVGTPYEIYSKPNNQFVANFMGKANFIKTKVKEVTAQGLNVSFAERNICIPPNESLSFNTGDEVSLMIRPEFMNIVSEDNTSAFEALVVNASYFGSSVEYTLELGGNTLVMADYNVNTNGIYEVGQSIPIILDAMMVRPLNS